MMEGVLGGWCHPTCQAERRTSSRTNSATPPATRIPCLQWALVELSKA